jgi:hypothetical protein
MRWPVSPRFESSHVCPTMPSTAIESEPTRGSPTPRADVLFVHIPKTAGISLYTAMARQFGPEHSLRYPRSTEAFKQQFLRLSDDELRRHRLISGHFNLPFWLRRDLGGRVIVALVREPVERALSTYRYIRSWTGHPRHALVGKMGAADYVDYYVADTPRHNAQCRVLCGSGDFLAAREMAQRQIDLLGAVEQIALLTDALSERLGVSLNLGMENRSLVDFPTRSDLDAALIARLESCNVEDCKLWAYVSERGLVRGHD